MRHPLLLRFARTAVRLCPQISPRQQDDDNCRRDSDFGVSKEKYLQEKLKMIKRLKLKSIAQFNKTKNEYLLNIALQKVQGIIDSTNESLKEELERLILTRSPQFQFRNIEKLEEQDLRELLSDLGIIDIIEDLEKLDNGD
jgi:hypothetical protein